MERIKILCFVLLFVGYVNAKPRLRLRPPVIKNVTDGNEFVVNSQNNVTLLCEGEENITWTYPNNTIEARYWSSVIVQTSEANGKYYAKLSLVNASYVDVDYYYCHAEGAAKDDKERSAKVYLYVRDENHLSVIEDIEFINAKQYSSVILPCRPTSPDVTVTLTDINGEEVSSAPPLNKHIGYELRLGAFDTHFLCNFERDGNVKELTIVITIISDTEFAPKPYIEAWDNGSTRIGDTYILNCTVNVEPNVFFTLTWITPNPAAVKSRRIHATTASVQPNNQGVKQGISTLTIKDVRLEDTGLYTCIIVDHTEKSNNFSKYIKVYGEGGSHLNLRIQEDNGVTGMSVINTTAGPHSVQWVIEIDSFPKAEIMWINNKKEEITKNSKFSIEYNNRTRKATLKINQITLNDSGVYEIIANNEKNKMSLNLTLIVQDKPTVHIVSPKYHIFGENTSLDCIAAGYPVPSIEWFFKPCQDDSCSFKKIPKTEYTSKTVGLQAISTLKMNASVTGIIECLGSNLLDKDTYTQGFYVTDVEEGFNIWGLDDNDQVASGSKVILNCAASRYNYTNDVSWYIEKKGQEMEPILVNKKFKIENYTTEYTHRVTLTIDPISKNDSAIYACVAKSLDTEVEESRLLKISVKDPLKPRIYNSNMNGTTLRMKPGYPTSFRCQASGIPHPSIIWTKDNHDWSKGVNHNHVKLSNNDTELIFSFVQDEDAGDYACKAVNSEGSDERTTKLEIIGANKGAWSITFIIITTLLGLFFLALVVVLVVKIKKEKKLRRELRIAGLMNFEKGALESLNPDLGVDDQAELLPYDKKWEFPRDKLKLGKQLGSGAFGVVMKAEAFGLVEGETVTTVAVKMVKRNADYTYIKALASELKIMVHLGKHLNVVNLLGACTKNVTKRELLVIVEYCRFGNLHNYLLRHRDDFVNQIDPKTGQIDTSIGQDFLNRTMSVGSNQSGSRTMAFAGVDYRATPNPSSTTDSSVVCSPTGEDTMILSNNSSVQPEWRSNYRGDYKGNVRPTSTHDLLCWAFQVARGMEYLASRKVLHGDLAARNILLAEDNIVKICDFGLAKSMYKSDNYKKKGDGPLPVKWMAVESIRDRVFSTQSDVWSFGIVLWEFFSLARTPYPGMDADERLYNKLVDGYRMDQPEYSTKDIYQIMLECWHAKPVYRPSFTKLADDLGNMLQDVVRKHYIDLNDPYIMMNTEQLAGHSDYLAMLSPPDYGNLASPGHDYVNGNTCPEEQPAESSGYLKMDIFSPRNNDSIFNFDDAPKNKNIDGVPASGVELLPMLHANESDSESPTSPTKSFTNPNYQTNPSMDSNKNSAPKKDSIVPTSDNYINMPQQKSAIKNNTDSFSNPSYIHMNNKNILEENDKSNYVNSHSRDWERPIV